MARIFNEVKRKKNDSEFTNLGWFNYKLPTFAILNFYASDMLLKYYSTAFLSLPLLPIMYLQGKKIKTSVPRLPEAKGTKGLVAYENSKETVHLLCVGESTIAGVGVDTHAEGFAGTLAAELSLGLHASVEWHVYARSGYTAKRVTEKIIPKIKETKADLIVVGMGGNNAFALHSPQRWLEEIQGLIEAIQLKFPNTPIAFPNMPPIRDFPAFTRLIQWRIGSLVECFGTVLEAHIKDKENLYYNPEVITFQNWVNRIPEATSVHDFFSDGVHPSKLTYQIWARDFASFLMRTLYAIA